MVKTSNNEEKYKGENNKTKIQKSNTPINDSANLKNIIKSLYKKKIKDKKKKTKMNLMYTTEYLLQTPDFVGIIPCHCDYTFTRLSPLLD